MERLVLVDALTAGYRPAGEPFFTLILTMRPLGKPPLIRATKIGFAILVSC